ncbi:SDR family NAD(P)-dependent oxidoreductase [Pararhizobium sp. LjRoot255]|uniref:SDR family NAD(P)-dependent oxidoreductase n=1 Tax=Pararhizobium sp. LjRoot255 TaxID=3342298 RepID=UPI003ED12682
MGAGVAVVTGASRGLGRGIARALGSKGAKVYVTGRTEEALQAASAEIDAAGGQGIAVRCDHSDDADVRALFDRIRGESGRLDILVNNATLMDQRQLTAPGGFWEKPLDLVDMIDVGLRSHYVSSYYAAPLMIETGGSLIAQISFYGAVSYHYGPAYGAAKAGTDKMSFDMAAELRDHGVACVSIWPGIIMTDELKAVPHAYLPQDVIDDMPNFETPEFTGLVIERLWRDPERMKRSGETLIAAEMGLRYAVKDIDGKQPRLYTASLGKPSGRFSLPA